MDPAPKDNSLPRNKDETNGRLIARKGKGLGLQNTIDTLGMPRWALAAGLAISLLIVESA